MHWFGQSRHPGTPADTEWTLEKLRAPKGRKGLEVLTLKPAQWYIGSFADPVWWGPGFNSWQWQALAVDLTKSQW